MLSDMVGPFPMAEGGEKSPVSPKGSAVPEETDIAQSSSGLGPMEEGVVSDPAGAEQLEASLTLH